jgi:membrane protease YdiL (CAAX protease family)
MYSKLILLCYKLIPLYYIVSLVLIFLFTPKNYNEPFAINESLPLTEFALMVLIFPIIEELYIRYWQYGKNNYFRVGFMVSFVLCVCFTLFYIFSDYINYIQGRLILSCIAAIGVIISYFLKVKKYNVDTIISFINSFNRSWVTVIIMSLYFTVYHMDGLHDFNWRFIIAYSFLPFLTIIARKYGIIASILMHIIHNTETASRIMIFDSAGAVYYYATVFLCMLVIIIYNIFVRQLDTHKKADVWKFTKKLLLFRQ